MRERQGHLALPFLFISFGNDQLRDQLTFAEEVGSLTPFLSASLVLRNERFRETYIGTIDNLQITAVSLPLGSRQDGHHVDPKFGSLFIVIHFTPPSNKW